MDHRRPDTTRKHRFVSCAVPALSAVLAFLLFATPALAHQTRLISATFGSAGSGAGQLALTPPDFGLGESGRQELFSSGSGVAVNDESGDVYVADTGNRRIDEFSSSGTFVRAFGADVGGTGVDVCTATCAAGSSSSAPAGFEIPTFIAVDNAASSLSKGDIYIADTGDNVVSKFDPEGNIVSGWNAGGQLTGFTALSGITVDSSGNLFVVEADRTVREYGQGGGAAIATFGAPRTEAAGLAVDAEEHLYTIEPAEPEISKFSATGQVIAEELTNRKDAVSIAVDPAAEQLLVLQHGLGGEGSSVNGYDVNCSGQHFCPPAESFADGTFAEPSGIAVGSDHSAYIADAGHQRIVVFSPPVIVPDVAAKPASGVTNTTATVRGTVNPDGVALKPGPAEGCFFEFGETEQYGQEAPCEEPVAAEITGIAPVPVHADLSGLTPERFYHYRLVAANANGVESSADNVFFTFSPPEAGPETCPNAALRAENDSLGLPDCRAYEQVSASDNAEVYVPFPSGDKHFDTVMSEYPMQASPGGDAVTYVGDIPSAAHGPEGTGNSTFGLGDEHLARRGQRGWDSKDVTPLATSPMAFYQGFSEDLTRGIFFTPELEFGGPLAPGVETTCSLLYAHSLSTADYQPLFTTESSPCRKPTFAGESQDGSSIVFESEAAKAGQTKKAAGEGHENVYLSRGGEIYPINVLPGAKPKSNADATVGSLGQDRQYSVQNGALSALPIDAENAVSDDGSRIFWTDLGTGIVYLRINPSAERSAVGPAGECTEPGLACTVQISGGDAVYRTAAPDGRFAYYTEAGQLIRFDVDLYLQQVGEGKTAAEAAALARQALTPPSAGVLGVLGINSTGADGTYIYLVANGVLSETPNGHGDVASPGACKEGAAASEATCNLYLLHDGTTVFIATLAPGDNLVFSLGGTSQGAWHSALGARSAEVTPDGRHLTFLSRRPLTGYDNRDPNGGCTSESTLCFEVYVYSADGQLACASCSPAAVPPADPVAAETETSLPPTNLPSVTTAPHWLSSDGNRVVFDSRLALLPADTNGLQDVYEWERLGSGTCTKGSPINGGGCLYLLSGARPGKYSALTAVDEDGSNIFFATAAPLTPTDSVEKYDLYDARVDGGFPLPVAQTPCEGSGCRAAVPAPPSTRSPGSSSFQAIEPAPPCPRGFVKKHGTCHRKKHHKKKAHRKQRPVGHAHRGAK